MAIGFNKLSETSPNFLIGFEGDVWMDVKQALLWGDGIKKMFKEHYFLYLIIINMSKTNRIRIDRSFMAFVMAETGFSRAYIYKCVANMLSKEMLSKQPIRGWYKVNKIKLEKK